MLKIDTSELQKIITGRVVPHIYSFVTNTLPNYLKVGDTYRPIEERLNEWRRHYRDLEETSRHKATVNDDVFFRDYAVHKYLQQKGITQVPLDVSKNVHSNEFFEGATKSDIEEGVEEIIKNYQKTNTYDYYTNFKELAEFHYTRNQDYRPRGNQKEVLNAFTEAINKGRNNLLMYAVMRFGKSITSIWAAKSINAKLTVVVSAKADVLSEWKQTVESHKDFFGYRFLDRNDLKKGMKLTDFYGKKFTTGGGGEEVCSNIVLFLTLQDLAGSTEIIKNHHRILQKSKVDLLIVDETHFGARAQVLGKILAGIKIDETEKNYLKKDREDSEDLSSLSKLEAIKADITLHLSGTPYRILMGSEFANEDIIAFIQFSDIYEAKLEWSAEHLDHDEWKNPYYGFPQMIRFAFNPNESSRKRLADIPGSKPSELFTPVSIKQGNGYKEFIYEQEVGDLLKVLDGSKNDANMLGLLDNETVKAGKLARHVVMVLPYRASCDALEELIKKNKNSFKNIAEYTVLNISGYNQKFSRPDDIKAAIQRAEVAGKKTITLTVNRMLTGSTVPQWDTMIYLKGTASPQEYDQAIFRLQSPWVQSYKNKKGEIVKYDMKPQTLLVDLDPTRLFYLQEMKGFTYGVNIQKIGNENIEKFIERELRISPVITLNAEGNKLVEVTATNIIDQARKYANDRTIREDVQEIGIDASLKDNQAIFEIISRLPELGGKSGLNIKPIQGEGEDLEGIPVQGETEGDSKVSTSSNDADVADGISSFEKRFRTYYVLIILFAFLSDTEEKSLTDVIKNLDANEDNRRIARHLGLRKSELTLIGKEINPFVRSALDYKIHNADFRSYDGTITLVEHIDIAIHKFSRLSEAEIFTPSPIVDKIYDSFDESFWHNAKEVKVLDIASKSGSFAKGFVETAAKLGVEIKDIKDNFYSIPTSPAAYEFTRKMYQALGLNVDNIAKDIYSIDLLKLDHDQVRYLLSQGKKFSEISLTDLRGYTIHDKKKKEIMKFTAVVGNPPYQALTKDTSDNPIYHLFVDESYKLADKVALIHPARFLFNAGKTPKEWNKKILNDKNVKVILHEQQSSKVFPNTDIKGGIAITYRDASKELGPIGVFTRYAELNEILAKIKSRSSKYLNSIVFSPESYRFAKQLHVEFPKAKQALSEGHLFDITTNVFEKLPSVLLSSKPKDGQKYIEIFGRQDNSRVRKYIREDFVAPHPNLAKYKLLLPKSNGTGKFGETLSTPVIAGPNLGHTQTFISIGALDSDFEAESLLKYIKTKFCRAMLGSLKITQDNKQQTWSNIPLQDFTNKSDIDWSKSVVEIDKLLYKKYGLNKTEIEFIEKNVKQMA